MTLLIFIHLPELFFCTVILTLLPARLAGLTLPFAVTLLPSFTTPLLRPLSASDALGVTSGVGVGVGVGVVVGVGVGVGGVTVVVGVGVGVTVVVGVGVGVGDTKPWQPAVVSQPVAAPRESDSPGWYLHRGNSRTLTAKAGSPRCYRDRACTSAVRSHDPRWHVSQTGCDSCRRGQPLTGGR